MCDYCSIFKEVFLVDLIKSITPHGILSVIRRALECNSVSSEAANNINVEISSYRYKNLADSNEPIEFSISIKSSGPCYEIFNLSLGSICDFLNEYLKEKKLVDVCHAEPFDFEAKNINGGESMCVDFVVKIVVTSKYTGKLEW